MEINFVFWKTSLFSKTFLSTRDVRRFLIFAFSIQICYFPWERCSLNLKGKPLMNDISYSTPKMPQLTISLLQPISNLYGIGIFTIPDHRGPHQSPKMTTHTSKKHHFPWYLCFVANIRYSTPKMTPLTISLLKPISNLSGIGISTILYHQGAHQSPIMATYTPKKQLIPQHLCFCG